MFVCRFVLVVRLLSLVFTVWRFGGLAIAFVRVCGARIADGQTRNQSMHRWCTNSFEFYDNKRARM